MIVVKLGSQYLSSTGEWTYQLDLARTWRTWLPAMRVASKTIGAEAVLI